LTGASAHRRLAADGCAVGRLGPASRLLTLVVLVVVMMAGCASKSAHPRAVAEISDIDWVLVSAQRQQETPLPPAGDFRAFLHFQSGGELLGNDGDNPFQGAYNTDGKALTISMAATTIGASGTAVDDPRVDAMDSLILPTSTDQTSVTSRYTVTAKSSEHPAELTIQGATRTVTFQPGTRK